MMLVSYLIERGAEYHSSLGTILVQPLMVIYLDATLSHYHRHIDGTHHRKTARPNQLKSGLIDALIGA